MVAAVFRVGAVTVARVGAVVIGRGKKSSLPQSFLQKSLDSVLLDASSPVRKVRHPFSFVKF